MNQTSETVEYSIKAILEKQGEDIILLNVGKLTSLADDFIICTATSRRQANTISEHVKFLLKKHGIRPIACEGENVSKWIIIDYGDVIVHIFEKDIREYYNLEEFWSKAEAFRIREIQEEGRFELESCMG